MRRVASRESKLGTTTTATEHDFGPFAPTLSRLEAVAGPAVPCGMSKISLIAKLTATDGKHAELEAAIRSVVEALTERRAWRCTAHTR